MVEANSLLKDIKFGVIKYSNPSPEAVLASTTLSQLLAVPYKYSDAGSNPREFQGMKSATNKKILESFLKNHNRSNPRANGSGQPERRNKGLRRVYGRKGRLRSSLLASHHSRPDRKRMARRAAV